MDYKEVNNYPKDIYRLLFEKASESIFLIDDSNKIIECNPKTIEMFKLDHKSDIIGLTPVELSPRHQPDGSLSSTKALDIIHKAMSGIPQVFEWLHKKKDDKLFHAEVSLNCVVLKQKKYLLAVVRDVSHRHLLKELHEIYDKVISVALNNLFVASRGYISLAIESGELSDDNVQHLQKSIEKHKAIENLIQDFEYHTKVQAETRFVHINLKRAIEQSITLIRQKQIKTALEIKTEIDPDIEVYAGSLLQNAFMDILQFVIDYTPKKIQITTKRTKNKIDLFLTIKKPISLDLDNIKEALTPSDFSMLCLKNVKLYIASRILDLYSATINAKKDEDGENNIILKIEFQRD